MSTFCVQIRKEESNESPHFRATAGSRQSVGRTMGEALDALMANWETPVQQTEVVVEETETKRTEESYEEPHLLQVNGVWVVAGGAPMPPEFANRDFVAEMYEERERSFWEGKLTPEPQNENPS